MKKFCKIILIAFISVSLTACLGKNTFFGEATADNALGTAKVFIAASNLRDQIPLAEEIVKGDFEKYSDADQELLKDSWGNVKDGVSAVAALTSGEGNVADAEKLVETMAYVRFELKTISSTITRNLDKSSAKNQVILRNMLRNFGVVDQDYDGRLARSDAEGKRDAIFEYLKTAGSLAIKAYQIKKSFD